MSREIKFRAWSNEHNRYCDFITLDENGRWIGWIKSSGVYLTTADIILEQDTGLKDKNGKEIYEGDIVKLYYKKKLDGIYVVLWDELNGEYVFSKNNDCDDAEWGGFPPKVTYRVIGNIHENPELLGGKK